MLPLAVSPFSDVLHNLFLMTLQLENRSCFGYSIWNYNLNGSLQYKVIYDVHIYSSLNKERKGYGSEGSGKWAANCTLNKCDCHSYVTENYNSGTQPPHFVNWEDQASDTPSTTYIHSMGSKTFFCGQPVHKTERKQ